MKSADLLVVGAGPSGLTLTYKLSQAGWSCLVVERDEREGGLSKSFRAGSNIYDIGPKRFHTDDPIVASYIQEVLANDVLTIGRSSKVHFLERFFDWPLQQRSVLRLPIGVAARCLVDLLRRPALTEAHSFPDYIKSRYGSALYELFFRPYTAKFLRWDPVDVHSDWATTGINRSIIDRRAKGNSITELLRALTVPERVDTTFLYPSQGGFGAFCAKLRALCENSPKVRFAFGSRVVRLAREPDGTLSAALSTGEEVRCGKLAWTGNLNDLLELLPDHDSRRLHYLNTILYTLVVSRSAIRHENTAQWIYVSSKDRLLSRISCPREFAEYTCAEDEYTLVCEVTDSQHTPEFFSSPQTAIGRVVNETCDLGLVRDRSHVRDVVIQPIRDTYPIYRRSYLQDFNAARRLVKRFSRHVVLVGRSGSFWYNNSDHSMRQALETAKYLLRDDPTEFDHRAYFGGSTAGGVASAGERASGD